MLSYGFNKFYNILLLKIVPYGAGAESSVEESESFDTILYLLSSQAPKSINLHLCEQKGKKFASSDCFSGGILTIFLQIGQMCFIPRYQPSYCCSGSVTRPFSSFWANSTQYLAHGCASSRALGIRFPVPMQIP